MMGFVDTDSLKDLFDLRRIVEGDLGPAPTKGGRAWLWRCPFHHEHKGYSLAVWGTRYRCFGACQMGGDLFDWLREYRGLSFQEALVTLGQLDPCPPPAEAKVSIPVAEPPALSWQVSARQVVDLAVEWLWSGIGENARDYLLGRGLTAETIQEASLGFVPGGYREWRKLAGMNVPCGITIPWVTGETLWQVKIRRASGQPKYVQIFGGSNSGLYRGHTVVGAKAVLFTEGEFDALVAYQEASLLVTPVTLGSASNRLSDRWIIDLITVPLILAAYDNDTAGSRGTARLQALSPRIHPVRVPKGKDLTECHLQGGDIYTWLAHELRRIRENAILASHHS